MELKDQVVSLELAKKLKELGFKQESLFWWHLPNEQEAFIVESKIDEYVISAYTVAELGSMLLNYQLPTYNPSLKQWTVIYSSTEIGKADKEAEARALLLIHLSEQGITTNQKENEII